MIDSNKKYIGVFGATMTIVGAMIGAGFASGKEIWEFFARFGWVSVLLVLPLGILMFFCFLLVLGSSKNIETICKIHKKAAVFIDIAMFFCHFCLLSAMIAGLRVLCIQMEMPVLFLVVFCAVGILLAFGMKTIFAVSSMIIPILIGFLLSVGIWFVADAKPQAFEFDFAHFGSVCINLILYVCMNVLSAVPILQAVGKNCKNKKTTAFTASVCICTLFLLILVGLILNGQSLEMPIFYLCLKKSFALGVVCFFVLLIATITTLFSCGLEVVDCVQKLTKSRHISVFVSLLCAAFVSSFGFGKIVVFLYPVLGIFGAIYICALAFFELRKKTLLKNS